MHVQPDQWKKLQGMEKHMEREISENDPCLTGSYREWDFALR